MKLTCRMASLALLVVVVSGAIAQDFQEMADKMVWSFAPERASIFDCCAKVSTDHGLVLTRPEGVYGAVTLQITKDGKDVFVWKTHQYAVFTQVGDMLVYADYHASATGCTLVAFDLAARKEVWRTPLKGLGPIAHTRYSNRVNLDAPAKDTLRVFGQESAGKYVELVDSKTGKILANRLYQ